VITSSELSAPPKPKASHSYSAKHTILKLHIRGMERHATEVFAGKGQLPGGKESPRWLKTTSLRVFSLLETHGILSPLVGIRMEAAHQEQMFTYLRPSNLFHRATDGDTKNTWRVPASLELLFNLLRNISVKAQRFLQVLPEMSVLLPRILHNIDQYMTGSSFWSLVKSLPMKCTLLGFLGF
jgi:hypothetical protein